MKAIDAGNGETVDGSELNGVVDDPDITIYQIEIKVCFYSSTEQNILDFLELSAEDVVLMFRKFKTEGFLPENCRVLLNTNLKKKFLSDLSKA